MPLSALELKYQLVQTKALIETRPVQVVFTPQVKSADGSGGKKLIPGTPRPPQQMRFVEQADGTSRTELGTQYTQVATLMGMPAVVVAVNDEFAYDGATWRVDEIQFPNEWEVRATVLRYGR